MAQYFWMPRAQLLRPGARRFGMVRGTLPKVKGAGSANAPVLNQRSMVGLDTCGSPTRLGRWDPPKEPVLSISEGIFNGKPFFKVTMPVNCQPPTIAVEAPRRLAPKRLPRPTGSS